MHNHKKTRVHTILFTEACPLACTYCHLATGESYGTETDMTKEQVFDRVKTLAETEDFEKYNVRILFTGGEPFLRWRWIKEIIEIYEDKFQYGFNTSGYLLTEEILQFLSNYRTYWVLSVDGGEKLTNYIRPLNTKTPKGGYYKRLQKILPAFLYHNPHVPFRIILNRRYLDLFYEQYLEAEKAGFVKFIALLDFGHRYPPNEWRQEDTLLLREQYAKIAEEFLLGMSLGYMKPRLADIEEAIRFILSGKESFDPEDIPCGLFNGRTLYTMYKKDEPSACTHCMSQINPDLEEIKKGMADEYAEKIKGMTPQEKGQFDYLCHSACPKNSYDNYKDFLTFERLEREYESVCYDIALMMLEIGNETLSDNHLYQEWLRSLGGGSYGTE